MIERTITCDLCKQNIPLDDNHICIDGYWTKTSDDVPEMHFHPQCWETLWNNNDPIQIYVIKEGHGDDHVITMAFSNQTIAQQWVTEDATRRMKQESKHSDYNTLQYFKDWFTILPLPFHTSINTTQPTGE